MSRAPTDPPSPSGGWSQSVRTYEGARVVPPCGRDGRILYTGVFDREGALLLMAATWRRDALITLAPDWPETAGARLAGQWLWGGVLYHHFGHFQMQSLARLWAMRRYRGEIAGVVFVTPGQAELLPFARDYLRLLIGDVPVRVLTDVTDVERLVVPGQGFGLGKIASGTRVFRRFVAAEFAREIAAEGPQDLFVSRSRQPLDRGGFVGEELLDARMAAAGYTVFWPEEHGLQEQIARYKAARRIVALDGSALHLVAMVARGEQKAAVILRRERVASRSLRRHMAAFMGAKPLTINALRDGSEVSFGKKRAISALDFEVIGRLLKRHGFIKRSLDWGPLTQAELDVISADHSA